MIVQFHGLVFLQDENIILNFQGFLDPIAAYSNHSNWQDVDHVQYIHVLIHVYWIWTQEVLLRFIT